MNDDQQKRLRLLAIYVAGLWRALRKREIKQWEIQHLSESLDSAMAQIEILESEIVK